MFDLEQTRVGVIGLGYVGLPLAAAGIKWNFLPFRPGLVDRHCIGIDPYYLTHKAQEISYLPQMILAGRRINDGMGAYVVERVVKLMLAHRMRVADSNILILGLTFKENCPDIRNSRVIDIVRELQGYNAKVDVYDPWANAEDARHEYGITPVTKLESGRYDALILAVAHDEFRAVGAEKLCALDKTPCVLFDVKGMLPADQTDGRL